MKRTALHSYTPLKRTPFKRKKPVSKARIDYKAFEHSKPVRELGGVKIYPDGRLVFNRRHPAGAHAYSTAVILMAERQKWLCSICGKPMLYEEASFEHGDLRGMGGARRQDSPLAVDDEGFFINSAAHGLCNGRRGSKRFELYAIQVRA